MTRFHGMVGFGQTTETSPGVHEMVITEKEFRGTLLRDTRNLEAVETVNSSPNINNRFSIVGDDYAYKNLPYIRYITWNGIKWAVNSVEVERPRLILTVRGVYNG